MVHRLKQRRRADGWLHSKPERYTAMAMSSHLAKVLLRDSTRRMQEALR